LFCYHNEGKIKMSSTRFSLREIGRMSTVMGVLSAITTGTVAAVRGNSVLNAVTMAGGGTAGVAAALSFFSKPSQQRASNAEAVGVVSMLQLAGTAAGYAAITLFIDAAASSAPIVDTFIGIPVSVGVLLCLSCLISPSSEPSSTSRPKLS
jgi:hypothetical protein